MGSSFHEEIEAPDFENLASLAENAVFRLPGCDDLMVRKTITDSYRDFCRRSCVLTARRSIELSHGRRCYPLCPSADGFTIDCVTRVGFRNGRELRDSEYSFREGRISFPERMLPCVDESLFVEVEFVEIPDLGSEKVPRGFVNRHGDAIVSCALMKLMSMSGRAWSDPQQAAIEARLYENALTECRMRHNAGGQMSSGAFNFIKKGLVV